MPLANASAEESILRPTPDASDASSSSGPFSADLPPHVDQTKLWTPPALFSIISPSTTIQGRNISISKAWKSWGNMVSRPLSEEEQNAIAQNNSLAYYQASFAMPLGISFAAWRFWRTSHTLNLPPFGRLRNVEGGVVKYRPYWDGETLRFRGANVLRVLPQSFRLPFVNLYRVFAYSAIGTVFVGPLALLWGGFTFFAKETQDPRMTDLNRERWEKMQKARAEERAKIQKAQGVQGSNSSDGLVFGEDKDKPLFGVSGPSTGGQQGIDDASPTGGQGSFDFSGSTDQQRGSEFDESPSERSDASQTGSDIWESIRQQSGSSVDSQNQSPGSRKSRGKRVEQQEGEGFVYDPSDEDRSYAAGEGQRDFDDRAVRERRRDL